MKCIVTTGDSVLSLSFNSLLFDMNYIKFKRRPSECHTGKVNDKKKEQYELCIKMQFIFV